MVQLISRKVREDILNRSYSDPMEFDGKKIKILKELPKRLITSRKDYRPLSEKLKNCKMRFRWEVPEGLSFFFKGKRWMVTNLETMQEAMQELNKEMRKGEEGSQEDHHGS